MARYTKMPVTIEAVQFQGFENGNAVLEDDSPDGTPAPEWILEARNKPNTELGSVWKGLYEGAAYLCIRTLEGVLRASEGDWIIRGIKGELYPCKPDIFVDSYMPAVPEGYEKPPGTAKEDLASCINRWSIENGSDTPDFLLAEYLLRTLDVFGRTIDVREKWHGRPGVNPLDRPRCIEARHVQEAIANGETYPPLEPGPYVHPQDRGCTLPPEGWYCTREPGHEGPCAAHAIEQPADLLPLALVAETVKGAALVEGPRPSRRRAAVQAADRGQDRRGAGVIRHRRPLSTGITPLGRKGCIAMAVAVACILAWVLASLY